MNTKRQQHWEIRKSDGKKVQHLSQQLGIVPLLSQLLVNRGIETDEEAARFLNGRKENLGFSNLPEIENVCERIKTAVSRNEKILVFGDYDADGVCATSIFVLTLKRLGAEVRYHIPDRLKEGYGLNASAIVAAAKKGFSLLVTFDCGITSVDEITLAKALGMDVIIVDHHLPGEKLPDALCILHPKLKSQTDGNGDGCPAPSYFHLCASGLAFALSNALLGDEAFSFSDIAALGTVADLVPLVDDNRILVKEGIAQLLRTKNAGLVSLLKICGLTKTADLRSDFHLPFILIPRINAAGRLWSPMYAVELLLSEDSERAEKISRKLDAKNKERQTLQEKTFQDAEHLIQTQHHLDDERALVLAKRGWHPGVVGIVASRLVELYGRPAVLLCLADSPSSAYAKGSARSIAGFHIHHALSACSELIERFGGHSMAAGLTIAEENIIFLREKLCELASAALSEDDIQPKLFFDAELEEGSMNDEIVKSLRVLSPFGTGNPAPMFCMKNAHFVERKTVAKGQHLQLKVKKNEKIFDAVWFKNGKVNVQLRDRLYDVAFTMEEDPFYGDGKIQLIIHDVKESA